MVLAALLFAQLLSQSQPFDIFDERYSVETKKRFETYLLCFAKGAYDRRSGAGSPEAHMKDAKAACRNEYDNAVAAVVKDLEGSSDATSAAIKARSFLDKMDAGAIIGPPAPPRLAQLPVEQLVGEWRNGNGGPLAIDMSVHFTDDGSLVGILKPGAESAAGVFRSWKVTSDGTKQAAFQASFADGRLVKYDRIPSFAGEMDFINPGDPSVQRFDLVHEDNELLIRWVTPDSGTQLRFHREFGAAPGN
ncbi:MAG: hypothetical protein ABI810_18600 [Sphingomonas bacterium]